nr:hypothetical protein [Tanacetum cinerariifolium]
SRRGLLEIPRCRGSRGRAPLCCRGCRRRGPWSFCRFLTRPGEDASDRVGRGGFTFLVVAVVARHGAVGGFGLHHGAVGRHERRGHQAQRAEALGYGVALHVAVVVFAGPHKVTVPLQRRSHHVVNQAVLVGDASFLELSEVILLVDFLEDVLEAAIVLLQDGVLGAQVQRPALHQGLVEAGVRKAPNRLVGVVHGQRHPVVLEVEHFKRLRFAAVFGGEGDGELALAFGYEVGSAVLVTEGVAADADGRRPVRH